MFDWNKFDKTIRPLNLIKPKMTGYVKTFKVKAGGNKLISFHIDDEKVLKKNIKLFGLRWKILKMLN